MLQPLLVLEQGPVIILCLSAENFILENLDKFQENWKTIFLLKFGDDLA